MLSSISLHEYSTDCYYSYSFLVDGHFGYFQPLTKAAMGILSLLVDICFHSMTCGRLLGRGMGVYSSLFESDKLFSRAFEPFYTLTSNEGEFQVLHTLSNAWC